MKKLIWIGALGALLAGCGGEEDKLQPPTINSVGASASTVDETVGTVDLTADVVGEQLTYLWSADSGTLDDTASETPTWTADTVSTTSHAPATVTATIQLTLTNPAGEAVDTVPITVTNVNEVPVIDVAAAASEVSVIPTGVFDLTVVASDPEGDGLAYLWEQVDPASPTGVLTNETTDIATWVAPVVAADTTFTFAVTITDTETGQVLDQATSDVTVPTWTNDIVPILSSNMGGGAGCSNAGCHAQMGGAGGLEYNVEADPDAAYLALTTGEADECDAAIGNDAVDDKYIDPVNGPLASIVWWKITDPTMCNQGGMPMNNYPDYWDVDNPNGRAIIQSWMLGGALNN